MKYIYLYSTETFASKNWYKIGESIKDPANRIKSQDNASNPEPLLFIHSWKVSDDVNDKKVHKELEKLGYEKVRKNREWFVLDSSPIDTLTFALSNLTNVFEDVPEKTVFDTYKIPHITELWWFNGEPCPNHST